jgi:hypothetical protein
MRLISVTGIALLCASSAFADATVDQKVQVKFGGAMSFVNVFGGKATHEGTESTVVVKGDRKSSRTGASGEIVDLAAEKIYRLDYDRKTYKVTTFDELRKQFEEQKARAEKEAKNSKKEEKQGTEMEVDFDVQSTGKKQTINGWATHQEIVTVTVREKGKKLEQSGGWVLTADMWIGPKIAAFKEVSDFDRRYMQKLYGSAYSGADMSAMMAVLAQTPAFAKAMKTFADKSANFDGAPVRTVMTFETVAAAGSRNEAKAESEPNDPSSAAAAAIGGLFKKIQKKREASSETATESAKPSDPNRSKLFDSTSELLKASPTAAAADVAIPADFKQK